MQFYEFVGLLPGNLADNEIDPVVKDITKLFADAGAEVKRSELIGRRKTAYAINNMRHAYYFLIDTELEPEKLEKLETKLKLHKQLVRFLLIKTNPKSPEDIENERKRFAQAQQPAKKEEESSKPKRSNKPIKQKTEQQPVQADPKKDEPVDIKALEKKLDEILDEDIT